MNNLIDGYRKFRREAFPEWKEHFHQLAETQSPTVLFITCSDSRIVPNLVLQSEPGDIFLCRNAGNIVPPEGEMAGGTAATIEYAVQVLGVAHVVVCGHSDCGAVGAVLNRKDLSKLPMVARWLRYVEQAWEHYPEGCDAADAKARHKALAHANIIAQLENLKTHTSVRDGVAEGRLTLYGWYYDIMTGGIEQYDHGTGKFLPLE